MMQKISERIYSVGVNDEDKVLFEGLWPLPCGVSYNSYIVADEKVALIDTVENGFEDEFLSNIASAIGDRSIDYLVVNHMEPDHSLVYMEALMINTVAGNTRSHNLGKTVNIVSMNVKLLLNLLTHVFGPRLRTANSRL